MKLIKIFLVLLSVIVNTHADEQKLEKISLQLQSKHQFEFAGFYAAQEKGYYKAAGLDVEFIEADNATDIVDTVLSEKADYGLSDSSLIAEYLNDKQVLLVANFFKQSPLVLITQKEITSLSQLRGSKIEGLSNNIHDISLYTMLGKFGIESFNIEIISPTNSLKPFLNKEVDSKKILTTDELFFLKKARAKYHVFNPASYGSQYCDSNLFTSQKEYQHHPKRVEKFKAASIRGWEYALKNKNEMISLIRKKYNSQRKSKQALLFEAKEIEKLILPKKHAIGSIDKTRVRMIAESFKDSGFIDINEEINLKDFIFDKNKIINQFTQNEKKYLQQKGFLTICVDPEWMPIEAVIDSKHVGIAADYWKLFEEKFGLKIKIFKTQTWNSSLYAMEQKKCDALSLSAPTQKRSEHIQFTDSFLELSFVVVTQVDKKSVIDFSLLDGTSIAVVKGYALMDAIEEKYPNINVVEVRNIDEGLRKVTEGEVFGFADSSVAIDYAYKNGIYDDFKVSAHFDQKLKLGLGVSKDNDILHSILQKVVRSIQYEQKRAILRKWFSSKYETKFDYVHFFQIIFVLGFIVFVVLYRHFLLKDLMKNFKEEY